MFAKNNGNKALGNSVQRFSIRKLSIGAASVLIGLAFTSWGTQTVKADDLNPAANTQQVEEGKNNTTTDNNQSKPTVTKTDDQTESTPVQKATGQSTQINGKLSSNSQPQNGRVNSTLVTTDNDHKVGEQKLETPKTAEVPAQIPVQIKEEIKDSKIAKTGVQLSEKTQSTNPSTTPDKAPAQEGNYNVNDWEGSIDSETHEYTLNKYNGSDKANIYIPNTYDFLKAGKIGDNDKVYIDEGLINRIVNNGAVTITVDSTGDPDKNKVYAKGSWDLALARSKKLKEVDLSHLDTSEITSAQWMFGDDTALTDANVANWSFNNNANLAHLFGGSTGDSKLQRVNMSNMDLRKVENLSYMFENATGLNTIDFQNTKFADNATTSYMFPSLDKLKIQLNGAKNVPQAIFDAFISAVKNSKAETLDLSNISLSSKIKDSNLLSGLSNVKQIDVTNFDISHVTDMTNMFSGDTNLTKIKGLSTWNVGNVTSMNSMFAGDTALTNLDLSKWKPLKVTNMAAMFKGCSGLKSITLNWGQNTKNVQNFSEMFSSDKNLTEINGLSDWDVSNATDFRWMFTNDTSLTEINGLSGWDVSNATQLSNMFSGDSSLKSMDLSNWKTSKVTDLSNLFNGDTALQTVNMSNMDLRNVNNFTFMFIGATSLSKIDFRNTRFLDSDKIQSPYFNSTNPIVELSGAQKVPKFLFDMLKSSKAKTIDLTNTSLASNITDLSTAFYNDQAVEEIDMTGFDTSHITNMSNMFNGANHLKTIIGIEGWDVSNATQLSNMFSGDSSLKSMDLSNWKTSKVTDMNHMFANCSALTSLNLSWGGNTKNVKNFAWMFANDNNLQTIDGIGEWNVSNATDMNHMFSDDTALTNLDLSKWKPLKVTNMAAMFKGCSGLKSITLNWGQNTKNVQNFSEMFRGDSSLTEVKGLSGWNVSNATNLTWMFGDDIALTEANVANWSFNNNANLAGLFGGSTGDSNLQRVDMSNMDLSKVSCLNQIFQNDKSLTSVDFRNTKFADKATTAWMFSGTDTSKINIQLSGAKNIPKDVFGTFKNAAKTQKVDKIDLSNASLSSEVTGSGLLSGLSDVKQIDVTKFDISHITDMTNMFSGDTNLTKIKGLSTWNVGNVTSMKSMFANDNNL